MPPRLLSCLLLVCCLAISFHAPVALASPQQQTPASVNVTLLADPHFDPFRDPSKVKRLDTAPVSEWKSILTEPDSPDAPEAYKKLQADCGEKGLDANHDLLQSAFAAAAGTGETGTADSAAQPRFVLVAGDLLVHQFDCRYRKLVSNSGEGLAHFAQKTINYLALQLHERLPNTPVYIALGNNDSGCGDYRLDPDSAFLHNTGEALAQGWVGATDSERRQALADYQRLGSYALPLPSPIQHARILVFDDIFLSARYQTCDGSPSTSKATSANTTAALAWLGQQLASAQAHHEQVWLLTHIPTGVNTYTTYLRGVDVCHGAAPDMFLSSNALSSLLAQYASTIRLVVAGHTHVDEIHLTGTEQLAGRVAMKTVPSISPVSNNPPSFLTATVDPETATLLDYRLHTASASTGKAIRWSVAYDFHKTYGEPAFTPATVADLLHRFAVQQDAAAIANYQSHMATGLRRLALQAIWPQYVCSLQHADAAAFTTCACQSQPAEPPTRPPSLAPERAK